MAPGRPYLDVLVKILIRYGVAPEHIPQQWTPEVLKAVHTLIGLAVLPN